MPNTLDDSEDFIADTPPAQIKKHQWRDITTEIDLKKGSSTLSPVFVNETDESDFENTPESSKENSKNVDDSDSDDSIIVCNKKKNAPVYVISSDSDEEPGDNVNESDEIISSSANFAPNVSDISYRNNKIIPEILDSDEESEESYSKSTSNDKGSNDMLPVEAGDSFIFNTSNKTDLRIENVKKSVFSPKGGDTIFEFENRDDSASTIENCTNDLNIVTIQSDESKDDNDDSFHTPANFKEHKSNIGKIPSSRELSNCNSNSAKLDCNSNSKFKFEDNKDSLKKFDVSKKFTPSQVKDLESELNKLNRDIEKNTILLQQRGMNLADKGAKLRSFIQDMQTKRDEKLSQLIHAKDNMTDDEIVIDDNSSPILDKAVTNYKDSIASTIPLEHRSDEEEKLNTLHRKQRALQQQLSTSHRLNDGGETLRKEISNINKEILVLEPQVKMKNPNYIPPGKGIAMIPPQSNSAWQKFRSNINISSASQYVSDVAQRIWGQGPASDNLYGGRMNEARKIEVVTVTKEAIEKLKKCLETMPSEADEEEQPIGLRSSITLFPHQKQALSWLLWRECQDVAPGGILADDMGLGKTLTLLSLILKSRQVKEEQETANSKQKEEWWSKSEHKIIRSQGTLIVCPASLIGHWEKEAKKKFKGGVFEVCMYHGANREQSVKKLARYDLVVTTYGTLTSEAKKIVANCENVKMDSLKSVSLEEDMKNVELFSIGWERIILDEAHQIRNPRSKAAQAVCRLRGGKRWAVTGTPLQNKQLDMYSLLRFLRCYPFDEYRLWKSWVDNGTSMGQARLNTIVKSILLRRTKCQTSNVTGKALVELPNKSTREHSIKLTEAERKIYDKVFAFSQEAMMSYMRRYVDKDDSMSPKTDSHVSAGSNNGIPCDTFKYNPTANPSTNDVHKFGVDGDVKAHHILILILRLRQICNHPSLIKGIIDEESKESVGLDVDSKNDDLISKMTNMSLLGEKPEPKSSPEEIEKGLENVLTTNNPIFQDEIPSSKIKTVVEELVRLKESHRNDKSKYVQKAVIVSQWTSMLEVVKKHVKNIGLKIAEINGKVNVKSRSDIVDDFNRQDGGAQVMLLSLGAGGVGLNLVGANHLFLLDMHWNPQLERQACDRIYRVGQTREVYIHKFLCEDTIERRILDLQEKKLTLAEGILTGAKRVNSSKLSLDDLKTLFSMGANEKATMAFTDDNP